VAVQSRLAEEIVVVDDGSTDGGGARVRDLGNPRIRLVTQENQGVAAARNRGVREASHDWIAFLDADDEWLPGYLEIVSKVAPQHPEGGVAFSNFQTASPPKAQLVHGSCGPVEDYFEFVLANGGQGMWSSSVLVHRSALIRAGAFPEGVRYGEDLDTWARLAWTVPVAYTPAVLSVYHTGGANCAMAGSHIAIAGGYQQCLRTYQQWRKAELIPVRFAQSSKRYAHLFGCCAARELKAGGDICGALRVLIRVLPYLSCPSGAAQWVGSILRICLPAFALRRVRQWREGERPTPGGTR
jgi:GT2 family glycosyltransferase